EWHRARTGEKSRLRDPLPQQAAQVASMVRNLPGNRCGAFWRKCAPTRAGAKFVLMEIPHPFHHPRSLSAPMQGAGDLPQVMLPEYWLPAFAGMTPENARTAAVPFHRNFSALLDANAADVNVARQSPTALLYAGHCWQYSPVAQW